MLEKEIYAIPNIDDSWEKDFTIVSRRLKRQNGTKKVVLLVLYATLWSVLFQKIPLTIKVTVQFISKSSLLLWLSAQ